MAVNGITLLGRPYTQSLRILQESGRTVELVLSQIYTHRPSNGIPDLSRLSNVSSRQPDVDYLKRIRYQTDETNLATQQRNEIKSFAKHLNGAKVQPKTHVKVQMAGSMCSAKSMPDLPKVRV